MEATEFRIGNLVRSKTWHSVKPISGIILRDDGDYSIMVNGYAHLLKKGYYIDIEPVSLTEDMLLNFGFVIEEMADLGKFLYLELRHDICFNMNGNTIWIGEYNTGIQYAHQLQNLYFALTQKELSLKDENTL